MRPIDPAWLDAQYDARAASPEHPAIFERWSATSAAARAEVHAEVDLRYGPGPLQTADWFAAPDPRAPVLVFVHGGYWRGSDKSLYSFLAPALVRAGATVVLPNYDLCPAVTIDAIVHEIEEAIDWVIGRAPGASRIVVSGHSAGGHLAACVLAAGEGEREKRKGKQPARLRSRCTTGLGISGLYELEPIRQVPFLAADLRLEAEAAARLSPVNRPPPTGAVFHAFVGADESDEFRRQSTLLAQRWGRRTVPVCATIGGRRHFDVLDDLADRGGDLFASAMELLFREE
jgi:arylformamidase